MPKTGSPVSVFKCGEKYFFLLAAVLGLVISPPLFAESPPASGKLSFDTPNFQNAPPMFTEPTPASVFGNYAGAGKCAPGSPKPCTDTGAMDNVFIQSFVKPETDEEKQIREFVGREKTDARVAIRILRDHGHSCTLEGGMYWSEDHLEFQDRPPYGTKICKLQLWPKDGALEIKDPGNACGKKFCFYGKPATLAGRHFKKGPDPLLAAPRKSATPPPTAIFGTYNGTGQCATDERKTGICREDNNTDYIVIKPSDTGDARVAVGSLKRAGENADYFCLRDVDAMWLGNHLAFVKEMPDSPGRPHLMQFWFKDDTVVVRNVWNDHCGTYIQGATFKKVSASPSRDTKR